MSVLPAYMFVYLVSAQCLQRPQEGVGSLELELLMAVSAET